MTAAEMEKKKRVKEYCGDTIKGTCWCVTRGVCVWGQGAREISLSLIS